MHDAEIGLVPRLRVARQDDRGTPQAAGEGRGDRLVLEDLDRPPDAGLPR